MQYNKYKKMATSNTTSIAFGSLTKEYDSAASACGKYCNESVVQRNWLTSFDGVKARVVGNGSESEPFYVTNGTKGCILAPTLFGIVIATMIDALEDSGLEGVAIHFRTDGSVFNLNHLKAKTKVQLMPKELFADDFTLVTHTEEDAQP